MARSFERQCSIPTNYKDPHLLFLKADSLVLLAAQRLSEVLVQLDPSCTQEYKWRELEEQRQAQKLQRQLQQEQAYLLSLQQNQNLDSSKTAQPQSTKPPQNLEQDRVKPPQSPEPDTTKQPQSTDFEKTRSSQNHSLEKTAEPKLPVADLQGPAPASEPIREVNPRSSLPSH